MNCMRPDCASPVRSRGLCTNHYMECQKSVAKSVNSWEEIIGAGLAKEKITSKGIARPSRNSGKKRSPQGITLPHIELRPARPREKYADILFEKINPGKSYKDYLKHMQ